MNAEIKGRSRRRLLDSIRRAGKIARIDLAQNTGMSQATVTTLTANLLRLGLIEEIARQETAGARRGRPRVDLKLRGAAHLVAGVKIANRAISVALVDFEGGVVAEHNHALPASQFAPRDLAEQVRLSLVDATAKIGGSLSRLSAVGVGIAGIVDANAGFCHWSPSLDQRNVSLREVLSAALDRPVFLDNDANLVAMAEQYFGRGQNLTDFIVVTIEAGVGLGIVLGNEIYRGTRGCGAEFGHTKVQLDGALCRCGQRGCLEAYVADYALVREANITATDTNSTTVEAVLQAARDGDPTAMSIIDRSGRFFAMGLANLVNIFDPQLIILSGERMMLNHLYAGEVIEGIKTSIVQVDMPPPEVVIHKWGDLMWARGAAAFAIDGVMELALSGQLADVA